MEKLFDSYVRGKVLPLNLARAVLDERRRMIN